MGTFNRMYVNGEWIGAAGGAEFEVRDPATGQVVGSVPDGGAAETQMAPVLRRVTSTRFGRAKRSRTNRMSPVATETVS